MAVDLEELLKLMGEKEASDLYLSTGIAPTLKVFGKLEPVGKTALKGSDIKDIANKIMTKPQQEQFAQRPEMNLALSRDKVGRFRINIFMQSGEYGMVIRYIKYDIPNPEELGLPPIIKKLAMQRRGLVMFVGATSTGKSTSLASIIEHRNQHSDGHIITIEDPIEFVHKHKRSVINQREVGIDTLEYGDALKNALRQAPDVILIGEVRSAENMEYALTFSETGHLCMSTLHANNANQAIDRIIHFFPEEMRDQVLLDLSFNLIAFVSQRLIPSKDGKRALAVEVMLGTPLIRDLIRRGEISELKGVMERSENVGMQTFDMALFNLYQEDKITYEEALRNADSANNLRLKISLAKGTSKTAGEKLSLKEEIEDIIEIPGVSSKREEK
ncbi:MAG: type IV pili twitching motility protein PilT [Legionellales bacterium]|nr:type IV pili twitching motility protein PilT [Legionellales bacterium]|tara:strand:- start:63594 stop:64754 length:1161 start_codon:yes stop_codon:yes gene_type:complete